MGLLQAALLVSQLPNGAEGFQAPPYPHHPVLARASLFPPPWPVSIPACAMSPFPSAASSSWPSGLYHPAVPGRNWADCLQPLTVAPVWSRGPDYSCAGPPPQDARLKMGFVEPTGRSPDCWGTGTRGDTLSLFLFPKFHRSSEPFT